MHYDATVLDWDMLTTALRTKAAGYLPEEAAINLLIEQESLLRNGGFLSYVGYEDDPEITGEGGPIASIDWASVIHALDTGELSRIGGAAERVLRIAASLAAGIPVNLRENASNMLGSAHSRWVVDAIRHATGAVSPDGS